MKKLILLFSLVLAQGCATVRQSDLDAWKGVPVEKLDTHPFWVTIPMKSVVTKDNVEHRFYINSDATNSCFANSNAMGNSYSNSAQMTTITNCVQQSVTCNNIFKIKDGIVLSYEPVGRCKTEAFLRPQ